MYAEKRGWTWGVDGKKGDEDIEREIMRFDEDALLASYGKDTARARSKTRTVRTFDLAR